MRSIENYNSPVSLGEPMNVETEDLIYADELEDGMIVLLTRDVRAALADIYNSEYYAATVYWCQVTKLRVEATHVTFVGLYPDGSKRIRVSADPTQGWFVKKDSIPEKPKPSDTDFSLRKIRNPLPHATETYSR